MSPPKVAIIAALEREVASAVKHWRVSHLQSLGRRFKIFETEGAAVICSGIGAAAAKAATDAAIGQFNPVLTVSLGFAGALTPELKVGKGVFSPYKVVDAATGAEFHTIAEEANGTLVSAAAIAVRGEKRELALRYQALAVDMEAAAVAQAASTRDVRFLAIKAISDDGNAVLLPFERFVSTEGEFLSSRFLAFITPRLHLWPAVWRMARDTSRAATALAKWLDQYNENPSAATVQDDRGLQAASRQ